MVLPAAQRPRHMAATAPPQYAEAQPSPPCGTGSPSGASHCHGKTNLLLEQMLNPTNPSRIKNFDARLAAKAERRAGQTLTAAMEYEEAEAHCVRARQIAAAKRAECKQRLDTKRSSHPVVAPGAPREFKRNNRGGKNTQPH